MLFNSLTFLVFFGLVLALHGLPLAWRTRKRNLLIASYVFYAAWNPPFVVLLWISTLTDWFAARGIAGAPTRGARRGFLALSLAVNLGLLGYFKYAQFALDNLVWGLARVGIVYRPPELDIVLPLGISFYTFQTLSYSIAVYRGQMRPAGSFLDYALFVTFFPQLVAGPIVRAQQFLPQCASPRPGELGWGLALLVFGLFEKVVLADGLLAPTADLVFASPARAGAADAWLATFAFSGQIFFDFAGYSCCAIGVAACLGFRLPENFQCPYAASGFSDFWRRWHITLSTWLRDHLYVTLGGNRRGALRTHGNLMLTMLVGGLWHGAGWSFVVWGGLHGTWLVLERRLRGAGRQRDPRSPAARLAAIGVTFLVVSVTWIFFRAESLDGALQLLAALARGDGLLLVKPAPALWVAGVVTAMFLFQVGFRDVELRAFAERRSPWVRGVVLAGMLCALALAPGDDRAFIYFQF